jgi:hypothetical protein
MSSSSFRLPDLDKLPIMLSLSHPIKGELKKWTGRKDAWSWFQFFKIFINALPLFLSFFIMNGGSLDDLIKRLYLQVINEMIAQLEFDAAMGAISEENLNKRKASLIELAKVSVDDFSSSHDDFSSFSNKTIDELLDEGKSMEEINAFLAFKKKKREGTNSSSSLSSLSLSTGLSSTSSGVSGVSSSSAASTLSGVQTVSSSSIGELGDGDSSSLTSSLSSSSLSFSSSSSSFLFSTAGYSGRSPSPATPLDRQIGELAGDGKEEEKKEKEKKDETRRRISMKPSEIASSSAAALIIATGFPTMMHDKIKTLALSRLNEVYKILFDAICGAQTGFNQLQNETIASFVQNNPHFQTPNVANLWRFAAAQLYLPHPGVSLSDYPSLEIQGRRMAINSLFDGLARVKGESFIQFATRLLWFIYAFHHLGIAYDKTTFTIKFSNYLRTHDAAMNLWENAQTIAGPSSSFLSTVQNFQDLLSRRGLSSVTLSFPSDVPPTPSSSPSSQTTDAALLASDFNNERGRGGWRGRGKFRGRGGRERKGGKNFNSQGDPRINPPTINNKQYKIDLDKLKICYACCDKHNGKNHMPRDCPHKEVKCTKCNKMGHHDYSCDYHKQVHELLSQRRQNKSGYQATTDKAAALLPSSPPSLSGAEELGSSPSQVNKETHKESSHFLIKRTLSVTAGDVVKHESSALLRYFKPKQKEEKKEMNAATLNPLSTSPIRSAVSSLPISYSSLSSFTAPLTQDLTDTSVSPSSVCASSTLLPLKREASSLASPNLIPPTFFSSLSQGDNLKSSPALLTPSTTSPINEEQAENEEEKDLRRKQRVWNKNHKEVKTVIKVYQGVPRVDIVLSESLLQDAILTNDSEGHWSKKFKSRLTGYLRTDESLSLDRFLSSSPFSRKFNKREVIGQSLGGSHIVDEPSSSPPSLIEADTHLNPSASSTRPFSFDLDNSPVLIRRAKVKKIDDSDNSVANFSSPIASSSSSSSSEKATATLKIRRIQLIDGSMNEDGSSQPSSSSSSSKDEAKDENSFVTFDKEERKEKIYLDSGSTVSTENDANKLTHLAADQVNRTLSGAIDGTDIVHLDLKGTRLLGDYKEEDVFLHSRLAKLTSVASFTDNQEAQSVVIFDKLRAMVYDLSGRPLQYLHSTLLDCGLTPLLEWPRDGKLWARFTDAPTLYGADLVSYFQADKIPPRPLTTDELNLLFTLHCQLAHASFKTIKLLLSLYPNDATFKGVPRQWDPKKIRETLNCRACSTAKSRRFSSADVSSRLPPSHPLEYLFIDTSGSIHFYFNLIKEKRVREALSSLHKLFGSWSCWALLIDIFSQKIFIKVLSNRGEAGAFYQDTIVQQERQTGRQCKKLYGDRGGENIEINLTNFIKESGIIRVLAPPAEKERQGPVEVYMRIVWKDAAAMLWQANLHLIFACFALPYAVLIRNQCPASDQKVTRDQVFSSFSSPIPFTRLFIFGSDCFSDAKPDTKSLDKLNTTRDPAQIRPDALINYRIHHFLFFFAPLWTFLSFVEPSLFAPSWTLSSFVEINLLRGISSLFISFVESLFSFLRGFSSCFFVVFLRGYLRGRFLRGSSLRGFFLFVVSPLRGFFSSCSSFHFIFYSSLPPFLLWSF